ncbi:hypothetical protein CEXT_767641 [Caerostris extrusa]|uniref:Uncharacterized protein n=1 Tax=Caerostris extrusa TaxID=172846 RepID=A0AAV4UCZ0_CAEEX|nr:hypothetical protein CEXT_767641 [Caerostris extrusa]
MDTNFHKSYLLLSLGYNSDLGGYVAGIDFNDVFYSERGRGFWVLEPLLYLGKIFRSDVVREKKNGSPMPHLCGREGLYPVLKEIHLASRVLGPMVKCAIDVQKG